MVSHIQYINLYSHFVSYLIQNNLPVPVLTFMCRLPQFPPWGVSSNLYRRDEARPVKYWAFISKLVSVVPLYHCILWLAMPK